MSIVDDIYQVFIDYFGEERVDRQEYSSTSICLENFSNESLGCSIILVHWPYVTVTNEYDGHVDIWDLYAVNFIEPSGRLTRSPYFIRSTYDKVQWNSGYLHSHVPGINKSNLRKFSPSCLGSGPIGGTISRLRESNEFTDTNVWRLYCWELDKYVSVESLAGGPYMRLQNIGGNSNSDGGNTGNEFFYLQPVRPSNLPSVINCINRLVDALLKDNVLKFSFSNGTYSIGSSYIDTVLQISNAFINLYNNDRKLRTMMPKESLFPRNFIQKMHIYNGKLYNIDNIEDAPIEAVIGTYLFTFKGRDITLQLRDFNQDYESSEVLIVGLPIINYIITTLLKYVNLYYGKTTDTISKEGRVI